MSAAGPQSFLVQLIHVKTKVRIRDIMDVLALLPECMAEAFMEAGAAEKERVSFGFASLAWRNTGWGPSVKLYTSQPLLESLVDLKYAQEYPLAKQMWELMHPKSKERVLERVGKGSRARKKGSSRIAKQEEKERLLKEALKKKRRQRQKARILQVRARIKANNTTNHQ
jgi:hypothetical protein